MTVAQFLVDFSPEPLLEVLLGPLERLVVLEGVQVGEHAHDPGEAVHLTNKRTNKTYLTSQ
jgi:hypothetical protein